MESNKGPDRRKFHLSVIYAMWAVITGAMTIPAAIYLMVPPRSKKKSGWVEAGDISPAETKRTGRVRVQA